MKSFKEVEKTRVFYHKHQNRKTVHRSSLMAPKFKGCITNISFLNHFLLKRNYKEVALKISGIDTKGNLSDSILISIDKPIVYSLNLDEFFQKENDITQYLIEFFSNNNLYIPFPAVVVNHIGKDFVNSVHAYNRILNDIFEDDLVNKHMALEASVDFMINDEYDTFFNFVSGIENLDTKISIIYENKNIKLKKNIPLKINRLNNKNYYLSKVFSKHNNSKFQNFRNVIKISQPRQNLFYGRLLAGIVNKKTGAFAANHSYYDSSKIKEYFNNNTSSNVYPYFENCSNLIRMYPIMSPSKISIFIKVIAKNKIYISKKIRLKSPGKEPANLDINDIVDNMKIKNVTAFQVVAESEKKIPTRVNHQLVYGPKNSKSKLFSSINVSLVNEEIMVPKHKVGFTWGQVLLNKEYESRVGVCFCKSKGLGDSVTVEFYNKNGLVRSIKKKLSPDSSLIFKTKDLKKLVSNDKFLWFKINSKRPDLTAFSFHWHKKSENSSGEHSF